MLEVLSWRRGKAKRWDWVLITYWLVVLSPGKFGTVHTHSQEGHLEDGSGRHLQLSLLEEGGSCYVRVTERTGCYLALLQCGRPAPQQSHPATNANSKLLRQTHALLKLTIAMSSSDSFSDSSASLSLRILHGTRSFVCKPLLTSPWQSHEVIIFTVKICYWQATWNSSLEQLNTVPLAWSLLKVSDRYS